MAQLESLLKLVGGARDGALLRYAIGTEMSKLGQHAEAEAHLRQALDWQPDYTAAWKLLGKTLVAQQQTKAACDAYRRGIEVAEAHGDIQAAREMTVFLRRQESPRD